MEENMPKVSMSTKLPVPAQTVWDQIGRFGAMAEWHPGISKSEQTQEKGATVRRLSLVGGGTIVERLEQKDDKERVYTYSIVDSPLPVANYSARLGVRAEDDRSCTVEWSSDFEPSGAPEDQAVQAIRNIYETGFNNLKRMYGG
jgi:Polyketide cyclase / dehydrase and lipid transport